MNPVIRKLHEAQLRKDLPEFRAGDTVRVNVRLQEGEGEKVKERLQAFEGVVISKKGRASGATFTVRRVSFGVSATRPAVLSARFEGQGGTHQARGTRRRSGCRGGDRGHRSESLSRSTRFSRESTNKSPGQPGLLFWW